MRIKDPQKLHGYFWRPESTHVKVPGLLTILDGGEIDLEIYGVLEEGKNPLSAAFSTEMGIGRIVGNVEKFGPVTLEHCHYRNRGYSSGISKSKIYVQLGLLGVAFDEEENVEIDDFYFSVDGINEWFAKTGLTARPNFTDFSCQVSYQPVEEINIRLLDSFTIGIVQRPTFPGFPLISEAKLSQQTYFRIRSDASSGIEDFMNIARKLSTFLSFSIDEVVTITSVEAYSNNIRYPESEHPEKITVIYQSLPFMENLPKISTHEMLFNFQQIATSWESKLNRWFSAYEVVEPTLNLYFSVRSGTQKYLEGKFLALIQSLETFHRRTSDETVMSPEEFKDFLKLMLEKCPAEYQEWFRRKTVYMNELSLRARLKKIMKPFNHFFGNSATRESWITSVVDTRNYLTHYDPRLSADALSGLDLYWANCMLEALIQLILLREIGFSGLEVKDIVEGSHRLKNRLSPKSTI